MAQSEEGLDDFICRDELRQISDGEITTSDASASGVLMAFIRICNVLSTNDLTGCLTVVSS